MKRPVPSVEGVLSPEDVARTADSIAAAQLPSGGLPWFEGGHLDPWDHVQAAMGLAAAGRVAEAERAYAWSASRQRADGSWAARYEGDAVRDPATDPNFCGYLATGVWHHWLVTGDRGFVEAMWPTVGAAVGVVLRRQRPDGAIAWSDGGPAALLTGNASLHLSLRCAVALAGVLGLERPDWELAAARLRHAVDHRRDVFVPKPAHAMDWYYPILGGALEPPDAEALIDARRDEFVVPGLGVRCVSTNPWVTGAETCELALALDVVGRADDARAQIASIQHLREEDGSYWTGLVFDDGARWPVERTTWTAATVILAADAVSCTTGASGLFRGDGLGAAPRETIARRP